MYNQSMLNLKQLPDNEAMWAMKVAYREATGNELTVHEARKMVKQFRRLNLHILEVSSDKEDE